MALSSTIMKSFDPSQKRDRRGRWVDIDGSVDLGTHSGPEPPQLSFRSPPPPQGSAARQIGGMTATGMTNTRFGDAVEKALEEQLGLVNLHPDRRQGPLDLGIGRYGFEVKACTTAAKEYKAKPKKHERESKLQAAMDMKLVPGTMIVVVDDDGTGYVYWREGIGSYRVGPLMHYAGTIRVDL